MQTNSGFDNGATRWLGLFGLLAGLALSPAVLAATFTGSMSGTWFDASRSGEGQLISFESVGTRNLVVIAYFTYDNERRATWLGGNADFLANATSVTVPLARGSGALFGANFLSSDVVITPAGSATLEFISCRSMRMRYSGDTTFSVNLTRTVGPLIGDSSCPPASTGSTTDQQLRSLIDREGLRGDASSGRVIPGIGAPLAQLGKLLFFSKSLSAGLDVACASCHHPHFGGADGLALSIGPSAVDPNVVGPGRRLSSDTIAVARNSSSYFNSALFDSGLFSDSRIESLGKLARQNGAGSGIRTPDSAFGSADARAGSNLVAAQARFPIVVAAEMRGSGFAGMTDDQVRQHVAARLGSYGSGSGQLAPSAWLPRFRTAFGSNANAEALITFDNIMLAISEYERSALFVESPWARYVRGDLGAISNEAKQGALVFFKRTNEGGAACAQCHKGDFYTDERHHVLGFPQVGPGAGNGNVDDFGRERQTGIAGDRYRHRTPTLLNVELTAPYGHAGAYRSLEESFAHYVVPESTMADFLRNRAWCSIPPFNTTSNCVGTASIVSANSNAALARMSAVRAATPADAMPVIDLFAVPPAATAQVSAFLKALTDPCLRDRACFGRWIPTPAEAPDAHQLNARSANGAPL